MKSSHTATCLIYSTGNAKGGCMLELWGLSQMEQNMRLIKIQQKGKLWVIAFVTESERLFFSVWQDAHTNALMSAREAASIITKPQSSGKNPLYSPQPPVTLHCPLLAVETNYCSQDYWWGKSIMFYHKKLFFQQQLDRLETANMWDSETQVKGDVLTQKNKVLPISAQITCITLTLAYPSHP